MEKVPIEERATALFNEAFGVTLNTYAKNIMKELSEKYGYKEVVQACHIVCDKYDDEIEALSKICGVLYNRQKYRQKFFNEGNEK